MKNEAKILDLLERIVALLEAKEKRQVTAEPWPDGPFEEPTADTVRQMRKTLPSAGRPS